MLASIMPLAKTPMDQSGASSLRNHGRQLERSISAIAPWVKRTKRGGSRGPKSGEIVVVLDAGESSNDPLYKGAKVTS
jgi:hypothetical protein